ncbi:hypothetical protein BH10PLA2_BH10PLA2_23610 [soil metagenome]
MLTTGRSGWIALGVSLLLHGVPAALVCFVSPSAKSHGGVLAFGLDTRSGPPRSMKLSLWDAPREIETSQKAEQPAMPAPVQPPTPSVAATPTQSEPVPIHLPEARPSQLAPNTSSTKSDYMALAHNTSRNLGGRSQGGGSGLGGTGSSGGAGGVGLLRVPREVQSVVFVVDGSSSRGSVGPGGSFERAKRERINSIDVLPATTRFQVIVYNRSANALQINGQTGLVLATEENKRTAAQLIRELDPEGSTNHVLALQQAISLQPEAILFVTDGDGLRADQVRALTSLNKGRSSIDTFELTHGRQRERSPLQILAEQNHGGFRRASIEER